MSDPQFCRFAEGMARINQRMRLPAGKDGVRLERIDADCAKRRVVWVETADARATAAQIASMQQNWRKGMCAGWPFDSVIRRGWKLVEQVTANGRVFESVASCPAR